MMTPTEQRIRWGTKRDMVAICTGFAIAAVGSLYGIWSTHQLDREHAPDPAAAFDRPIARLALLVTRTEELGGAKAESELEKKLLERLTHWKDLAARLIVLLFRLILFMLILSTGLLIFAGGLSARRFSRHLSKLIATGELVPAGSESAGDGPLTGAPIQ